MLENRDRVVGGLALVAYVAAIYLANWLIVHVGFIEVFPVPGRPAPAPGTAPWWLLVAPAGVYMAGLTFPLRDLVQRGLGRWWGVAAIVLAAGLTYAISPVLAVASGVTFLVSEGLDMAIYTPMARRWFVRGVAVSSVAAAVVDSLLFLALAGIPYSVALAGQITGKLEVIALVGLPVTWFLRRSHLLAATAP